MDPQLQLLPALLSLLRGEEHQALTEGCKQDGAREGPAPGQAAKLQDRPDSEQDVRDEEWIIFWIESP